MARVCLPLTLIRRKRGSLALKMQHEMQIQMHFYHSPQEASHRHREHREEGVFCRSPQEASHRLGEHRGNAEKVKKDFNAKALGRKDARDMQSGRFVTETPVQYATTIQTA